jgi:DNA-binding NarL/FixJ family response regulator
VDASAQDRGKRSARVVVAAADPDVRGVLARELDDAGFTVCAAEDGADGLIAAASRQAPDACVFTSDLGQSGLIAMARLSAASPRTKVVVVASDDEYDCLLYLLAGASGYIEAKAAHRTLASTVRSVVAGLAIIPPAAQRRLLDALRA